MQAAIGASRYAEFGAHWIGQVIDGRFPLQRYLGGSGHVGSFVTQIGGEQGAKAVIKLALASSCNAESQLACWRRVAKLSHPNLIRIFDGGRCWLAGHEVLFVAMEYADENLGEVLPRRVLTSSEGEAMLRPMIEALKYVHGQGLVHGRLRPSNVMAVSEQLKISSDSIRPAGEIKGTLETSIYDAPELRSGKISSAADVWSLGATLAESFTRKTSGQNSFQPGVPKPFGEIVQHCLRESSASRWTLPQIEAHLRGMSAEKPVAARVPAPEFTRTRRLVPGVLVAVLLGIIAAIYGLIHSGRSASQTGAPSPSPVASSGPISSPPVAAENISGGVVHEVSPKASQSALRTIHGRIKVRVRVGVDTSGNVTSANLITAGPSKYFARLASEAARGWKFTPSLDKGEPVSSQWTILFEYTRSGITQQASKTSP
jgi:TonB family protein